MSSAVEDDETPPAAVDMSGDSGPESTNDEDRAQDRVLNTPELLEMVLLEVPSMFQLFVIQRVSKTFKGAIDASVKLQRKMWLRPDAEISTEQLRAQDLDLNPLLHSSIFITKTAIESGMPKGLVLKPGKGLRLDGTQYLKKPQMGQSRFDDFLLENRWLSPCNKLPVPEDDDISPSWRRMLITRSSASEINAELCPWGQIPGDNRCFFQKRLIGAQSTIGSVIDDFARVFDGILTRQIMKGKVFGKLSKRLADRAAEGRYGQVVYEIIQ